MKKLSELVSCLFETNVIRFLRSKATNKVNLENTTWAYVVVSDRVRLSQVKSFRSGQVKSSQVKSSKKERNHQLTIKWIHTELNTSKQTTPCFPACSCKRLPPLPLRRLPSLLPLFANLGSKGLGYLIWCMVSLQVHTTGTFKPPIGLLLYNR